MTVFQIAGELALKGSEEFSRQLAQVASNAEKASGRMQDAFTEAGEGNRRSQEGMRRESERTSDAFTRLGRVIATAFSVRAIVSFTRQIVSASAEINARNAQFSATFREVGDSATAMFQSVSKATGVLTSRLQVAGTKAFAQFKGAGLDAVDALAKTEEYLNLASDASAYYDISLEEADTRLRSFIRGNVEAGDMIGLFTSETQRNTMALRLYGVQYQKLNEVGKQMVMLEISREIYRQSGAMGQAQRESGEYANVIGNLTEKWQLLMAEMGNEVLTTVLEVSQGLIPVFESLTGKVREMNEWIGRNRETVGRWAKLVATAVVAVTGFAVSFRAFTSIPAILTKVTTAVSALNVALTSNPIGAVITLVADLGIAFTVLWNTCEGFRDFWIVLWDKCKWAWNNALDAFENGGQTLARGWAWLKGKASTIWDAITVAFSGAGDFLTDVFTVAWSGVRDAWGGCASFFSGLWDGIKGTFSDVGGFFREVFTDGWEAVSDAFGHCVDWFASIRDGIRDALLPVGDMFNDIGDSIGDTFAMAWDRVRESFSGWSGFFSGLWDDVESAFSGSDAFFSGIADGITGFFGDALGSVVAQFGKLGEAIWDVLPSWLQNLINWTGGDISGAWGGSPWGKKEEEKDAGNAVPLPELPTPTEIVQPKGLEEGTEAIREAIEAVHQGTATMEEVIPLLGERLEEDLRRDYGIAPSYTPLEIDSFEGLGSVSQISPKETGEAYADVTEATENLVQATEEQRGFWGALWDKLTGKEVQEAQLQARTAMASGGVAEEAVPALIGEAGSEAVVPLEDSSVLSLFTEKIGTAVAEMLGASEVRAKDVGTGSFASSVGNEGDAIETLREVERKVADISRQVTATGDSAEEWGTSLEDVEERAGLLSEQYDALVEQLEAINRAYELASESSPFGEDGRNAKELAGEIAKVEEAIRGTQTAMEEVVSVAVSLQSGESPVTGATQEQLSLWERIKIYSKESLGWYEEIVDAQGKGTGEFREIEGAWEKATATVKKFFSISLKEGQNWASKLGSVISGVAGTIDEYISPIFEAIFDYQTTQLENYIANLEEELEALEEYYEDYLDELEDKNDKESALLNEEYKNGEISYTEYIKKKQALDSSYAKAQEDYEEQVEAKEEEIAQKKDELAKKQFEADKKTQIAQVAVNLAQGIMRSYATSGWILGTVYSALLTAAAAVQIATIKSQQYVSAYAKGGLIDKPTIGLVGEDGAEAVVPLENNLEWVQGLADAIKPSLPQGYNSSGVGDSGMSETLSDIREILRELIAEMEDRKMSIYVDGRQLASSLGSYMDVRLGTVTRLSARGV